MNDPQTRTALDTSGVLPDGTKLNGPDDLRHALAARPDQFVQALTERLMTYALGRSIDYRDMPTVRQIVRTAAQDQYRFAAIVEQVVSSDAFRKREAPAAAAPAVKTVSLDPLSSPNSAPASAPKSSPTGGQ